MSKLLTSTLGAVAIMGQVPDLREGDCVRALDVIEYEDMKKVDKHARGMVTGKGILWEGRDWKFEASAVRGSKLDDDNDGPEMKILFKQRNAVIHRSMVEKMPESEGYGQIRNGGLCLTMFEIASTERKEQAPKIQWWTCQEGWVDQMFILPACRRGPGQIRFAKDPKKCVQRDITQQKLVLSDCDWTQSFIFESEGKKLKVGVTEDDITKKDTASSCFKIAAVAVATADDAQSTEPGKGVGASPLDASCSDQIEFDGLWDSADMDR